MSGMSNYNFVAYKEQHINIILVSEKWHLIKKSLGDMTPERLRGNERLRGERLRGNITRAGLTTRNGTTILK